VLLLHLTLDNVRLIMIAIIVSHSLNKTKKVILSIYLSWYYYWEVLNYPL